MQKWSSWFLTQFRTLLTGLEECKCVLFESYVVCCIVYYFLFRATLKKRPLLSMVFPDLNKGLQKWMTLILDWFKCSLASLLSSLLPLSSTLSISHLSISTHVILPPSPLPCSCHDQGQSYYQGLSGSGSAEDEYLPIRHRSARLDMTRLGPPPHRPNPRGWMDEARSRDSFSSRSGTQKLAVCQSFFLQYIRSKN